MGILDRILRAGEGKKLKALAGHGAGHQRPRARDASASPTTQLQAKTAEFRQRLANGADLDDIAIEAFAVIREAATRVIGQRHFDVQLMGGAALHFGWVAEMKTGEGKTLVSTLPAYLNGARRQGRPPRHGQRLPGPLPRRVDGPHPPLPRPRGRPHHPRLQGPRRPRSARSTPPTSPTARTTSSASTTCATTWPASSSTRPSAATTTPSSTRSTRSSSTRPARR